MEFRDNFSGEELAFNVIEPLLHEVPGVGQALDMAEIALGVNPLTGEKLSDEQRVEAIFHKGISSLNPLSSKNSRIAFQLATIGTIHLVSLIGQELSMQLNQAKTPTETPIDYNPHLMGTYIRDRKFGRNALYLHLGDRIIRCDDTTGQPKRYIDL